MINKKRILVIILIIFMNLKVVALESAYIVYKIDGDIITNIDIKNEKKYLIALNQQLESLNENNPIGSKTSSSSYLSNTSTISNDDKSKSLSFNTRQNKITKATEFYNLIYQYRNDCLIAGIEYNKDYYRDGDLKPEENIFFKLTIIPFGKTSTPNLK